MLEQAAQRPPEPEKTTNQGTRVASASIPATTQRPKKNKKNKKTKKNLGTAVGQR